MHDAIQIAAGDVSAILHVVRIEFPRSGARQGRHIDTLRYVDRARELVDVFERTLNTVEDTAEDAGAQFDGQRLASTKYGIADRHAAGFFVHLERITRGITCN